jgi:hypothetical protein
MSKSRLLSGKSKKKTGAGLSSTRYSYLDVSNAEADLGLAPVDNSILVGYTDGRRVWENITTYANQFKGYTGSQGFIGSQGFTGSQGFNGSQGFTGSAGTGGSAGLDGATGFTGSIGFTGSAGFTGSSGFTGSLGYTGSQGDIGFTGSSGTDGSNGTFSGFTTGTAVIANTTTSFSTGSGAMVVWGGVGIGGNLYVERSSYFTNTSNYIANSLILTTATVNQYANQTAISVGTDTAISVTTSGNITSTIIWNTSTLQSVTNRGNVTTNQIRITNDTTASGLSTGALQVTGGASVNNNLYIGGKTVMYDDLQVYGDINFIGTATQIIGAYGVFQGNQWGFGGLYTGIVGAYNSATNTALQIVVNTSTQGVVTLQNENSSVDATAGYRVLGDLGNTSTRYAELGLASSYFDSVGYEIYTTSSAFLTAKGGDLILDTESPGKSIYFYTGGTTLTPEGVSAGYDSATLQMSIIDGVGIRIPSLTTATNTTSGSLSLSGGIGAKNAYLDRLTVNEIADIKGQLYVDGALVLTTGSVTLYAFPTIVVAGTDTAVFTSTGVAVVWNTSTFDTVASRGSTSSYAIRISNTASSTSTYTGALVVAGGVAIQENLRIAGNLYVGNSVFAGGNIFVDNVSVQSQNKVLILSSSTTLASSATNSGVVIGQSSDPFITWLYDGGQRWVSSGGIVSSGTFVASVGGVSSGTFTVSTTTNATSTTSGALQVVGGAGIGQDLYIGGQLYTNGISTFPSGSNKNLIIDPDGTGNVLFSTSTRALFYNTTTSTSTTTGAVVITGGLGVGGAVNIGQTSTIRGAEIITTATISQYVTEGGGGGGGGELDKQERIWNKNGSISPYTSVQPWFIVGNVTVLQIQANLVKAPEGAPAVVNILSETGTTYATLTVPAGLKTSNTVTTSLSLTYGNSVYIRIASVGTSVAGSGMSISFLYTRS